MFKKFGVQLYTIRDFMQTEEDIAASFKKLKALGYDEAQTAGCAIPYADFGRLAKEAGIEIVGTHDKFDVMLSDTALAIENHCALGTTNMGVGGPSGGAFESVENLKAFIDNANTVAERIAPHGFKFTYHNHSREFSKLGGEVIMETLVRELDKDKVSFVLDTYWVQNGGGDVRYWLEKLAGRVDILHLKDMAVKPGTNESYYTEIGNGNLYWDGILATAEATGVKHYVVEEDRCPGDPFDSLKMSADFLKKYQI
ncbi:MAG: sugar phosphate isomerase/epimerase [Ruminococcaceae bacterium]|nr:sugar phosphate isomerase/epimerase [Oscillospiraceae bacterium]